MTFRIGARSGRLFGRGAATNFQQDLANSDCILIMGSNMAEAHPVGFRWPMKARERGATLIHVDPRFSRTSACCNMHVQIRAGTDIAFLGGLINYVLTHEKWFKEYVLAYTNATTIISEDFKDTEDLEGIFSGYTMKSAPTKQATGTGATKARRRTRKPAKPRRYGSRSTGSGRLGPQGAGERAQGASDQGMHGPGLMGGASTHESERSASTLADPKRDPTLQDPRCAINLLRKHYARYTPEMVAARLRLHARSKSSASPSCCAPTVVANGPARSFMPSAGRSIRSGPQIIRAAGILQQLLGNIGRPWRHDHGDARPLLDPGQH